ncbi:MAG TPA: hypothetical protein VIL42_03160 [Sphingomicrobium sp.]|jgi:hypothetical protein
MNKLGVLAAGVSAAVLVGAAPAGKPAAPTATYWMDVTTQSGMGAGMGQHMNAAQMMRMMNGGGGAIRSLDLRLASKTKPAAAPQADHLIPQALMMGASLPLLTPVRTAPEPAPTSMPTGWTQPKGRMLIYWGCGEHAGANQPTIIDFAKMQPGKMPPGMAAMASMAKTVSAPTSAAGFGQWPNERDSRQVPVQGSLIGAHKIQANYSPPIAFSLGAGQDFMPALGLREAGALPSGAMRLTWNPAPTATGYALAMFGANAAGEVIMWSSANKAQMAAMDYLSPSEVKRQIAAGTVLPPSTTQCILPAEVAAASPQGMVQGIGYGPEANFSDDPKAPKWATKVRFKTSASLIRGMGDMMQGSAMGEQGQPQQQPAKKKRRGLGIGDLINAIPR